MVMETVSKALLKGQAPVKVEKFPGVSQLWAVKDDEGNEILFGLVSHKRDPGAFYMEALRHGFVPLELMPSKDTPHLATLVGHNDIKVHLIGV